MVKYLYLSDGMKKGAQKRKSQDQEDWRPEGITYTASDAVRVVQLLFITPILIAILVFVITQVWIGVLLAIGLVLLWLFFWWIRVKREGLSLRQKYEENKKRILFSVQEWGIIVEPQFTFGPQGKTYKLAWSQIHKLYEDKVWDHRGQYPAKIKYLFIMTKGPTVKKIMCDSLNNWCWDFHKYKKIEEAVTYYSKGKVPYVKYSDYKKKKKESIHIRY